MEIVSKLLGHSRMGITQAYYGEILDQKVSEAIRRLNEIDALNYMFGVFCSIYIYA